jgi:hypothetical protein
VIPEVFINSPAKMKKGIASKENEFIPMEKFWIKIEKDNPLMHMANNEARLILIATGTPKRIAPIIMTNIIISTISLSSL